MTEHQNKDDDMWKILRRLENLFGSSETETRRNSAAIAMLEKRINQMSTDLTKLVAEVERTRTIEQSAVTLVQGLRDQIAQLQAAATAANVDQQLQSQIDNLVSSLDSGAQDLAKAVSANTAEASETNASAPASSAATSSAAGTTTANTPAASDPSSGAATPAGGASTATADNSTSTTSTPSATPSASS